MIPYETQVMFGSFQRLTDSTVFMAIKTSLLCMYYYFTILNSFLDLEPKAKYNLAMLYI